MKANILSFIVAALTILLLANNVEAGGVSCVTERQDNFTECASQLLTNVESFVNAANFTGFLDELCSAGNSFPLLECIAQYSADCPGLLDLAIVNQMQFGPYHLEDIAHFTTARSFCDCTSNIGCIEQMLSIQTSVNFKQTSPTSLSPWKSMPNYNAICDQSTKPWIQCASSGLWRCKSGVTAKYGASFTIDDADQIERLGAFVGGHCTQVTAPDFATNYSCVESQAKSMNMQACFLDMDSVPEAQKPCVQRRCIENTVEENCDAEWVNFFIDAVNIYGTVSVPRKQCDTSGATTVAASSFTVLALVLTIVM